MTLLEWGALGELIGGIAIIVSLIYVGRQLKQSNSMARSAVRRELSSELNVWATSIASSPSLTEALAKVHFHSLKREDATDQERVQIAYIFVGIVGQLHFAYEQCKEGIMTERELEEYLGSSTELFSKPYLASLWPVLHKSYPTDFNEWFERQFKLRSGE